MKDNEFKCDMCKKIYPKEWSDEEAEKEAKYNFGEEIFQFADTAIVCDDCYKQVMII